MTASEQPNLAVIGWRERVALPDLNVVSVKAKIDTGARSSALHAFDIEFFTREDQAFVRFRVHPSHRSRKELITVEAKLIDTREVRNSGGKAESRPVIETTVSTGSQQWPIELTLTNRDVMGFPMLLGRQAVRGRFLVDSGQSYLQSAVRKHKLKGHKKTGLTKKTYENSNSVEKLSTLFDTSP